MSDHKGARLLYPALPQHSCVMIGDKGYDSGKYRAALVAKGITPCIPPQKGRKTPASCDKHLYRQRHKIENLFARLKNTQRIHTLYDRREDIGLVPDLRRSPISLCHLGLECECADAAQI